MGERSFAGKRIIRSTLIFNYFYVSFNVCFQEYGLLASVNRGLISIICDAGMRGLADELNPKGFNEYCSWHSFRIGVRTHQDCLKVFDKKQPDKLKKIMNFCTQADKDLSKKDMKKRKLRSSAARGINSYLDGLELNDENRLRICRFTQPKGWKSKFNNDQNADMTDEEIQQKRDIMKSRKIIPKIKVILAAASR